MKRSPRGWQHTPGQTRTHCVRPSWPKWSGAPAGRQLALAPVTVARSRDGTVLRAAALYSERRRTMTQNNRTQEIPTPAPDSSELTAPELAGVVGGADGPPSGSGTGNGVLDIASPILM